MHLRTRSSSRFKSKPNFDSFDRLNRHYRLSNPPIELSVPLGVRAEPKGQSLDPNFNHAAECISGLPSLVDQVLDRFVLVRIQRVDAAAIAQGNLLGHGR